MPIRTRLLALGLLLVAAGCDGGSKSLLPVAGKVSYHDLALPGGIIVFTPDHARGCRGAIAMGEIQPDGSYSLRTGKSFGAAPGWYRVTVAVLRADAVATLPGQPYAVPASLVPEKYRHPELSRLQCEVKADRANTIDFSLD